MTPGRLARLAPLRRARGAPRRRRRPVPRLPPRGERRLARRRVLLRAAPRGHGAPPLRRGAAALERRLRRGAGARRQPERRRLLARHAGSSRSSGRPGSSSSTSPSSSSSRSPRSAGSASRRAAALAGALVLLFSGVFQTVPLLFTTVAVRRAAPARPRGARDARPVRRARHAPARRRSPGSRSASRFSAASRSSRRSGRPAPRRSCSAARSSTRAPAGAATPAGASPRSPRRRSSRRESPPSSSSRRRASSDARPGPRRCGAEEGALFWSVRPARLLTLLEPRLTGDPQAEDDRDYWGASTFDAGNPYFHDLALGLVPLVLAAAAARRRARPGRARPRGAGGAPVVRAVRRRRSGRFSAALPVLRYPEKWWILATLGLCGAAAIGVDRLRDDDGGAEAVLPRGGRPRRAPGRSRAPRAGRAGRRSPSLLRASGLAGGRRLGGTGRRAARGRSSWRASRTALLLALLPRLVRSGTALPPNGRRRSAPRSSSSTPGAA